MSQTLWTYGKHEWRLNCLTNNAFASWEAEGFVFSDNEKQFILSLVERVDIGELTWDEAVDIIKEKRHANNDNYAVSV